MRLHEASIGDILVSPQSGRRFKIEAIDGPHVHFSFETGEQHISSDRTMDLVKLIDAASISDFEKNLSLSRILSAAESSAIRQLACSDLSGQDRADADLVLRSVGKQRQHLEAKLSSQQPKHSSRLNDLISSAESRAKQHVSGRTPHKDELNR